MVNTLWSESDELKYLKQRIKKVLGKLKWGCLKLTLLDKKVTQRKRLREVFWNHLHQCQGFEPRASKTFVALTCLLNTLDGSDGHYQASVLCSNYAAP
jgi:hypothetical protein